MFLYVVTNTNTAWDFGMMIIKHWESTIFPGYYWVTNILAGIAFLFLVGGWYVRENSKKKLTTEFTIFTGVMVMGFVLTWVYMFWSQHIVHWYGDMPNLIEPDQLVMEKYQVYYWLMLLGLFIIPFFALLFRKIKGCMVAMNVLSVIVLIGLWMNRYIMIMPFVTEGEGPFFFSWTGVSLILGGLAATILPVIIFYKLFPKVTITTYEEPGGH